MISTWQLTDEDMTVAVLLCYEYRKWLEQFTLCVPPFFFCCFVGWQQRSKFYPILATIISGVRTPCIASECKCIVTIKAYCIIICQCYVCCHKFWQRRNQDVHCYWLTLNVTKYSELVKLSWRTCKEQPVYENGVCFRNSCGLCWVLYILKWNMILFFNPHNAYVL
jgi:hypothetical protein